LTTRIFSSLMEETSLELIMRPRGHCTNCFASDTSLSTSNHLTCFEGWKEDQIEALTEVFHQSTMEVTNTISDSNSNPSSSPAHPLFPVMVDTLLVASRLKLVQLVAKSIHQSHITSTHFKALTTWIISGHKGANTRIQSHHAPLL
jgi:hypothetical protein